MASTPCRRMTIAGIALLSLVRTATIGAEATQQAEPREHKMRPVAEYRAPAREDEISMARSAAPPSISADASIMVLGAHGYESAASGKNGFTCLVLRSWSNEFGDTEFWNSKIRAPICYNAAAASTVMPVDLERTEWVMAGRSEAWMRTQAKTSSVAQKSPNPGSMAYMMSKQQHLSDRDGHWHPHLMLYQPHTENAAWGANLPGSPLLGLDGGSDQATVFVVAVGKWSDGSPSEMH